SCETHCERCLSSDRPTSMAISVTITTIELVREKSSPSNACCVASPMIISSTKSKVVSSARERRPAILNSTISARYIAAARNTESIGHLRENELIQVHRRCSGRCNPAAKQPQPITAQRQIEVCQALSVGLQPHLHARPGTDDADGLRLQGFDAEALQQRSSQFQFNHGIG